MMTEEKLYKNIKKNRFGDQMDMKELIKILDTLDKSPWEIIQEEDIEPVMEKIRKTGHAFPHSTNCMTCTDDFYEIVRFVASYIKKLIEEG